jgi:4-amino-4-deoxy-L-arabinose transferase-like glycosyltransferase
MQNPRNIFQHHLPLIFFWGLLFLAVLPFVEMRASDEAIMAGVARDIIQNHHFLPADFHFQGRPCTIFPLYPWLVAICSFFREPTAFTVRLPSVLAVLGLATLAGRMARQYKSDYAGLTAALVVLTSFVMVRVGYRAHTETLHALLMTAAWFTWYNFGPQRHRWGWAWGLALGCVLLDILNVGLRAAILFYLPIIFTRMPPRVQRRLLQPAHVITLLCYLLVAYIWITLGKQPVFAGNSLAASPFAFGGEGFFHHLFLFPIKAVLYLMPWGVLVWAPFCEAQRRFEPAGSLCGFLRAVFLWPFLLTWLTPGTSPLLLLPLLAPLAVLIGIHAEVVLRRNALFCQRIAKWGGYLTAAAMFLLFIGWFLIDHGSLLITPTVELTPALTPIALSRLARFMELLLLAVAGLTLWKTRQSNDAERLAWCAFACFFAYYIGFAIPRDYLLMPDRVYAARALLGTLPPPQNNASANPIPPSQPDQDIPHIYLETTDTIAAQLNGQMYYLELPVTHVQNLPAELPGNPNEVWLLSQKFPLYPNWDWTTVSPEYNLNQLREIELSPIQMDNQESRLKAFFHSGFHYYKKNYDTKEGTQPLPRYRPAARFRLYHGKRLGQ